MTLPLRSLLDHRLIIVTGKGGVGKTAISCALAEAARRAGKRVVLAETASIEAVAERFEADAAPLGYEGRSLRPGLHALQIDPFDALADYVRLQIGLGVVTDRILRTETFQHLLEAAPGWRELIILGKIWHLEQACDDKGDPLYDLIVVDAPATGHGLTFLDVPRVVQQAVRAGPLARHASWVEALVHDRERTILLPVTLAEELPVTETIELIRRARRDIDIGVDRIIVNRSTWNADSESRRSLAGAVSALSEDRSAPTPFEHIPRLAELRMLVEHSARRDALAETQRLRASHACDLPIIDFPAITEGFSASTDWARYVDLLLEAPTFPDAQNLESRTA